MIPNVQLETLRNIVTRTHIHVSPKYAQRHLGEFAFRANHREMSNAMFNLLVATAQLITLSPHPTLSN
jgi:hypothetical protein